MLRKHRGRLPSVRFEKEVLLKSVAWDVVAASMGFEILMFTGRLCVGTSGL